MIQSGIKSYVFKNCKGKGINKSSGGEDLRMKYII